MGCADRSSGLGDVRSAHGAGLLLHAEALVHAGETLGRGARAFVLGTKTRLQAGMTVFKHAPGIVEAPQLRQAFAAIAVEDGGWERTIPSPPSSTAIAANAWRSWGASTMPGACLKTVMPA